VSEETSRVSFAAERQRAQGIDRTDGGKIQCNALSSAEKQKEIEREK
jgi:hypothetical protein